MEIAIQNKISNSNIRNKSDGRKGSVKITNLKSNLKKTNRKDYKIDDATRRRQKVRNGLKELNNNHLRDEREKSSDLEIISEKSF